MLCHAGGTVQQDPAAPGVRAGPAMARVAMPGPKYEALLDIKVELETEIATYCSLLEEGEDFDLVDALDKSHSLQTIQKTTTCRTLDGKVAFEVNDTKVFSIKGSRCGASLVRAGGQ